jgi:Uncharacterized protein conserved in bacteria (DUF2344).
MIKAEQIFKYRIKFSKSSNSAAHHELRKMIKSALAESGLPFATGKTGPRVATGPGAGDGESSLCEYADICLLKDVPEQEINLKLSQFISGGFKIIEVKEVPYSICSVEALAQYALYTVGGIKTGADKISEVTEVEIIHENGIRELLNIKTLICSVKKTGDDKLELILRLNVQRSACLRQILTMLPGLEVDERKFFIERSALLWQSGGGNLIAV